MSGVAIIRKLLKDQTAIPVIAGVMPQNQVLPAIGVMQISERKHQTLHDAEAELIMERVQVTVVTKDYATQKEYLKFVKATCKAIEKIISLSDESVLCKSIIQEFVGPDFYDSEVSVYQQSVDFMVKYQRSS